MSKNIVSSTDGIKNAPGQDLEGDKVACEPTNVPKLYHYLDGKRVLCKNGELVQVDSASDE